MNAWPITVRPVLLYDERMTNYEYLRRMGFRGFARKRP
jgi:hypothetical protein